MGVEPRIKDVEDERLLRAIETGRKICSTLFGKTLRVSTVWVHALRPGYSEINTTQFWPRETRTGLPGHDNKHKGLIWSPYWFW